MADEDYTGLQDHERHELAALTTHPVWTALRSAAKVQMERQFQRMAQELMQGKTPSPESVEYARGFFAGMKFLLDTPTIERRRMERVLAKKEEVVADA